PGVLLSGAVRRLSPQSPLALVHGPLVVIELDLRLQRPDFTLAVAATIPARGVTAVFGPSGSGKTTLLRCIAGLEPQVRGRLSVAGGPWQDDRAGIFLPAHRRPQGF